MCDMSSLHMLRLVRTLSVQYSESNQSMERLRTGVPRSPQGKGSEAKPKHSPWHALSDHRSWHKTALAETVHVTFR